MRIERVVEIEYPGLDVIEAARRAFVGLRHVVRSNRRQHCADSYLPPTILIARPWLTNEKCRLPTVPNISVSTTGSAISPADAQSRMKFAPVPARTSSSGI